MKTFSTQLKKIGLFAMAAALLTFGTASQATLITSSSPSYNFAWNYNSGTAAGQLSGNGSMTVSGFNSSLLSILISLNNTSGLTSNRLTAFGFGIDPNATSVALVDGNDAGMIKGSLSKIPGLTLVEVCAFGGVNCAGGANGGVMGGGADVFTLLLGGTWGSSVNIDPVGFKFQTGSGSFEFTTVTTVPEPAALSLLGIGLVGLGFLRRRKAATI